MKILIAGAAGYQAEFIIRRLQAEHELTLFDRVKPDIAGRFIKGDICSFDDVMAACAGQDAVIHLVALVRDRFDKPHGMFADVMVKGTWNVAEACVRQGVQKLVNISSIVVCGTPAHADRPFCADDPPAFRSGDLFYSLSKHLGEQICRAYHQAHGLGVINIRPGVIAGDGLNTGPRKPEVNPGDYWFMYVHPEDVAQLAEKAVLSATVTSGTFFAVAGHPQAMYDWQAAARQLGYKPQHNWEEM